MLIPSEDKPANELLVWLGGSTSGGSARVNATLRALGLRDTDMYGGYEVQGVASEPSFVGKRTTASDFGRLLNYIHLAADGRGLLARLPRQLVPPDARFLLADRPRAELARAASWNECTLHKPGWITRSHDGDSSTGRRSVRGGCADMERRRVALRRPSCRTRCRATLASLTRSLPARQSDQQGPEA
jgi:hypothetical protein